MASGRPRCGFIVKPLRSPILDAIVTERREWAGNTVIRQTESAKEVMKLLRRKVLVGILIDQNVDRHKGVPVDFFARKTYTTDGIARLALAMRARSTRRSSSRIRRGSSITCSGSAPPSPSITARPGKRWSRVTRRCNEELEKAIREAPDQWMWFQPPLEDAAQGRAGRLPGAAVKGIVFLDRDGTLIEEVGYLRDPVDVRVLPGAAEALRRLSAKGYLLAVRVQPGGAGAGEIHARRRWKRSTGRSLPSSGKRGSRSTRWSIAPTTRKGRWKRTGGRAPAGSPGPGWRKRSFGVSRCRIRALASWSVIK